tara:strand:- start:65 stop:961 length:897 start_codon:yes stop_codon:yes gene_type:complete
MPVVTNKFNLPETFERFQKKNAHSPGGADITVTSLIDSPQVFRLRREYSSERVEDVSDNVMSIIGTAVHKVMEEGAPAHYIVEERLHATVNGLRISGAIDIQIPNEDNSSVTISDYKTCSSMNLSYNPSGKPEWTAQLNSYAALARLNGKSVHALEVIAICRDWTRSGTKRYNNYPESAVVRIEIPLWDEDKAYAYLEERVAQHTGGANTQCTDEERWLNGSRWAVMKEGRKTAVRLFDSEAEAASFIEETSRNFPINKSKPVHSIVERLGTPTRCEGNYCGVRDWCKQYNVLEPIFE